jgi:hypothetical protein
VRPLTWGVVLLQVGVVFAVFAAVHARELFAGHALARAAGTVTYAEYLHAGFTRLLCATVLAIATVVLGHVLLRDRGASSNARAGLVPGGRGLTALEVALLGLVGIALASSWQRSTIYEVAYGYTYLRLAVRFIEVAIGGLIALTAIKAALRSWRGYAVAVASLGLLTVLGAACFNADLYIARENVARAAVARAGNGDPYAWKTLDVGYLEDLTRDALPVLDDPYFAGAPDTAAQLRDAWVQKAPRGWRSYRGLGGRF